MRHLEITISSALMLLVLGSAAACSSGTDEHARRDTMELTKTCVQTRCDAAHARDQARCSSCFSICDSNCGACDHICEPTTCVPDDDDCASSSFEADLPAVGNATVREACLRYVTRVIECGASGEAELREMCDHAAKVERSDAAGIYGCAARLDCAVDPSPCRPEPTTFGVELCTALERGAGSSVCSDDDREELNRLGAWVRDDVLAVARSCATQASPTDVRRCFEAWRAAVNP